MLDKNIQDKISFSGVILSVQPRSNAFPPYWKELKKIFWEFVPAEKR